MSIKLWKESLKKYNDVNNFKYLITAAKKIDKTITVYDTETTGLIHDDNFGIFELGCFHVTPNGSLYYSTIRCNPNKIITNKIIEITGVDPKDLINRETFDKTMAEAINHFRTNHILFGFNNIDFDSKGIEKDFKRYNLKLAKVENGEYDLRSGEKFLTGDKSLKGKLHEICRKYGIEITNSELHGAGYDSFITAMLLDRLIGIYGIDIITNKIIASNFQKPLRF